MLAIFKANKFSSFDLSFQGSYIQNCVTMYDHQLIVNSHPQIASVKQSQRQFMDAKVHIMQAKVHMFSNLCLIFLAVSASMGEGQSLGLSFVFHTKSNLGKTQKDWFTKSLKGTGQSAEGTTAFLRGPKNRNQNL